MSAFPIVVLISKRGSNLKALLDAVGRGEVAAEVRAVVSNRADAEGLNYARAAGIPAAVIDHKAYADRASFDAALAAAIDCYAPKLVVLAGFMRILTADFVRHYRGRLLNIHPSLLPALRGLDTHARALAEGHREHGASVHLVTEELDAGPVILQAHVPLLADDTPETLAARVLQQEHRIYPQVIAWFSAGRRVWDGSRLLFDGVPLQSPRSWAA